MSTNDLASLVESARSAFAAAATPADLENAKAQYTGKAGRITELMKGLGALPVEEKKARDIPDVEKDTAINNVKPKLLEIGAIALAPSTETGKASGLITYFAPYAVGPYVEGEYVLFVPWTAFKDHLSAEGAALFGGERPADDVKKDEQ